MLFSEGADLKTAAGLLADRKAEVIPWLLEILDTKTLYEEGSLGNGYAPANAVGVLGKWQALETLPRLLHVLEDEDWESVIHDQTVTAVEDMGAGAVEPLLAFAEGSTNGEVRELLASILSVIGKGNERAYELILAVFNQQKQDFAIEYMAENLLAVGGERAIAYLEACLQKRKYSRHTRNILQRRIEEARRGEL